MRVPTFVCLFRDDATTAKGPGCDEGANLRLRDFEVFRLMPTRDLGTFRYLIVSIPDPCCLSYIAVSPFYILIYMFKEMMHG